VRLPTHPALHEIVPLGHAAVGVFLVGHGEGMLVPL
jgi:hypothetical protein